MAKRKTASDDNTAFNMTKLQEEIGPVENNKSSCK